MRTALWTIGLGALAGASAHAALVRGPYLQTPTPTSMIVRWRTDAPSDSRVTYGAAPGALTSVVASATPTTEHVVALSGLTPDSQYYYAVGSVAGALVGDDADHYFRTAPTPGSRRPFRIWTIGDAGFTNAFPAFAGNLDAVRDAFRTYNGNSSATDLFVLLGDNAYILATDADYQDAVFNEHAAMLRTTPVYSTFGNHEDFSSNDVGVGAPSGPYFDMFSFPAAGEAGGVASGTEAYYAFDYGNVHFIVLNSEGFAPSTPTGPMITWLQSDLAATTADWIVAVFHRPPYSKGSLHDSDVETNEIYMRANVGPILEAGGVDLVLNGHSHSYERSYFLNGHYGLSGTFSAATHVVEPGDGDPAGGGAYHKPVLGPDANQGAVYVVNGSGSEVRPATLNHPAHVTGLLELGSVVIDVDGDTLTASFLTSTGDVDDRFRIVKGDGCPSAPQAGCADATRGRMLLKNSVNDGKDRLAWKWKGASFDAATIGNPKADADLAACVYDAAGTLVGGTILHGASEWSSITDGFVYKDRKSARHGFQKVRVKGGLRPQILVKGRGATLEMPTLPASFPVTAQLVNRDTGVCWQSVFATPKRNGGDRVTAAIP